MIEVNLKFNSVAEALVFLSAANGIAPSMVATDKPAKGKTETKTSAVAEAQKPEAKVEPTGPKREDVSAKVVELATKDQASAVKLLKGFGVTKARELKDEDLAAALKGAEEALALLDMA